MESNHRDEPPTALSRPKSVPSLSKPFGRNLSVVGIARQLPPAVDGLVVQLDSLHVLGAFVAEESRNHEPGWETVIERQGGVVDAIAEHGHRLERDLEGTLCPGCDRSSFPDHAVVPGPPSGA